MLSEIIFASVPRKDKVSRPTGISGSSLFPCAYRLLKVHEGATIQEDLEPRQILNMSDGWTQENQTVERLAEAGIKVYDRQREVEIGKSKVKGHIDGLFNLGNTTRLFEHKAWSTQRFTEFSSLGIEAYPQEKAQTNGYLLGLGLEEVDFIVKCKENNDYSDQVYKIDRPFIEEIVEWADKIRLEGWKPEPKECKYCAHCGLDCFGSHLDFSSITNASSPEMVKKYTQGYMMKALAEQMMDEARSYFVGKEDKYGNILVQGIIGDKDTLMLEGLTIKKIIQHRFDISKQKIVEFYGPEALVKVGEENNITQYRFKVEV